MAGILVAIGLKGMAIDVNLYVAKLCDGKEMTKTLVTQLNGVLLKKLTSYRYHGGAPSGLSVILGDDVEDAVDSAYDAGIVVVAVLVTMLKRTMEMLHLRHSFNCYLRWRR